MNCTSINVSLCISLCISLSLLISSVILGILYIVYMDNKFGEISLYLFVISFLTCLIRANIKDEEKNKTKVTPI